MLPFLLMLLHSATRRLTFSCAALPTAAWLRSQIAIVLDALAELKFSRARTIAAVGFSMISGICIHPPLRRSCWKKAFPDPPLPKYPEHLLSGMKMSYNTLRYPLMAYMVAGVTKSKNAAASPTEPANSIFTPLVAFKSWKALSLQNEGPGDGSDAAGAVLAPAFFAARDAAVKKPSSELELCRSRQQEGVSSGGNNPISGSNHAGNGSREGVTGYEIEDKIEDETEDTEAAGLIRDDRPAPTRAVSEEAASELESARECVPRCCATLAASEDNGGVRSGRLSGLRDFEGLSKGGRDCVNAGDGVRAGEGHGDVSNVEADNGELEQLTEPSSSSHLW
ncbi:hypothetical protein B0H17DRAFT_1128302 [Mycena rosella]|uniref:Uncharacterized protein n=1 Tax=Mycena rosella TaxID=1033263 RepID=A0AAD7DWL8_MYCRO|nr:hypothetical protein B0H17DRAFT_1128302 [Mycena rosella]